MPRSRILIAAVAVLLLAGAAVALLAGGASADEEFRRQAVPACERQAEREAQRIYIGDPKRSLEADRKRLTVFLEDLRRIEPTDEARPEWTKIIRIYESAIRKVDEALKKMTGKASKDRRILGDIDSDVESVYAQPSSLFPKAGLPECDIPRTAVVKDAEAFRFAADDACVAFVRSPFLAPVDGRGKKAALRQLARLRKMTDTGRPKGAEEVPKAVAALYREHMLEPIDEMRRELDEAEGRIGDRASTRTTVSRAIDEFDDFYSEYLDGSYTLRLDACLAEQRSLTLMEETFERGARRNCAPVAKQLARAADRKSLPALRAGVKRLDALMDRLAKLKPPPRSKPQWRRALRAGRAVASLLNELLGKAGTLSATQVEAYERRLTSATDKADRAFAPIGVAACMRVF